MSLRHFASSSRHTLLHPHFPSPSPSSILPHYMHTTPLQHSPIHPTYVRSFSQYLPRLAAAEPTPQSQAGFDSGVSQAYSGHVDQRIPSIGAGSGGKGKEREKGMEHAAPPAQPVATKKVEGVEGKRRLKAKKNAISMTPAALDRLRDLVSSPTDPKLLRITVKSRGCAGMAYHLDYVPPPGGRFDEVVEQDGVKVLIDSKALFSIIGSRMDWRDNRLSAGFVFDNPNVVDTCGCGESFNIQ